MWVGWYSETPPRFTVPCEGNEARFYTVPTGNRPPCMLSRGSPLHYCCVCVFG